MKIVVVGAIDGYTWKDVEVWHKSLMLTGFQEEIHMLVYNCTDETKQALVDHNIFVHECIGKHKQVVVNRFRDLAGLTGYFPDDTWMVCTDVGDIAFQADPRVFLSTVQNDIVVASEGIFFNGNKWVRENLMASFPQYYQKMEYEILYNAGSIAAKAGILSTLSAEIYAMCMSNPNAKNHDQAAMNILLREPFYKNRTLFTMANDPWCYCGASSMFAKPEDARNYHEMLPVIRNGLCYIDGDRPTTMFHHYTRDKEVERQVRQRVLSAY